MIKGVNKNVIEIKDTGNAYFEKAVLYINPDYSCRDAHILRAQADKYLNSIKNTKYYCWNMINKWCKSIQSYEKKNNLLRWRFTLLTS